MVDILRDRPVPLAASADPSFGQRYRFPPGHEGAVRFYDASECRRPQYRHSELELNLVTAGTGIYLIRDRPVDVSHRCALWLFPKQDHILLEHSTDYRM
jgi:hypothetical protein